MLFSRKPKARVGTLAGDLRDSFKHFQRLKIAAIKPAKNAFLFYQPNHCRNPQLRLVLVEKVNSLFMPLANARELIEAPDSVTLVADRSGLLGELRADVAELDADSPSGAGHLARSSETSDNGGGLFAVHGGEIT